MRFRATAGRARTRGQNFRNTVDAFFWGDPIEGRTNSFRQKKIRKHIETRVYGLRDRQVSVSTPFVSTPPFRESGVVRGSPTWEVAPCEREFLKIVQRNRHPSLSLSLSLSLFLGVCVCV